MILNLLAAKLESFLLFQIVSRAPFRAPGGGDISSTPCEAGGQATTPAKRGEPQSARRHATATARALILHHS